jgi:hypothetical protein
MSRFGSTLFAGSPFLAWTLIPILLLFAVGMPLTVPDDPPTARPVAYLLSVCAMLLALGLFNPRRFAWAFRIVCAMVALTYLAYMLEMFFSDGPFFGDGRRSSVSPVNSLLGFLIIGLPCLCYAVLGRFTFRKEEFEEDSPAEEDEED